MKSVIEKLAERIDFDLWAGDGSGFTVKNPGYMDLHVSCLAPETVAVYHWFEQNGDMVYDPEIVFAKYTDQNANNIWFPVSITQSIFGYSEICQLNAEGKWMTRNSKELRSVAKFANDWARNIRSQGFLDESLTIKIHGQE